MGIVVLLALSDGSAMVSPINRVELPDTDRRLLMRALAVALPLNSLVP